MKPLAPERHGVRNRLLGRLSAEAFRRLQPSLERMDFQPRASLYELHRPLAHVYFPETGVASIVTVLADGTQTEVATVGLEGMVGLPAFWGVDAVPNRAFWQIAGTAWRLPVEALRGEKRRRGSLEEALGRYTQAFLTQVAQSATCNGRHAVQQRCSRWLLMTHDRVDGDAFDLKHEFLAQMLGVRRAGVTVAAGALQKAGLIRYAPGRLTILDREGLEAAACECYGLVRREFERLLG
jgi:CRP-like cAMP-binding protein